MHRATRTSAILLLISSSFAACSDPATQNGTSSSSSGAMSSSSGDAGMAGMGGSGGGGSAGAGGSGGSAGLVPANGDELFPWLQAGNYMAFQAESAQHASTGPHGGKVRTFVNPILFDALTAGSTNFPMGSSAVKELWGTGAN